jgi:hypothetical protein
MLIVEDCIGTMTLKHRTTIKSNMDVHDLERLSIFTPRHKLKLMSSAFIAVLHLILHLDTN